MHLLMPDCENSNATASMKHENHLIISYTIHGNVTAWAGTISYLPGLRLRPFPLHD